MPKITINDQAVEVPDGTTVLQACQVARQRVPYYCYHPGLSVAGNCRICLVDIEGSPKLQVSCNTPVREGMVVRTQGERVVRAQQEVLEFLLINHPLDCPVCDQAGECELQNYYLEYGAYDPKFNENKVKKPKAVPIGKHVMLDAERCILCSRCVRFCDEVSKTGELGIFNRGDRAQISVYPGRSLDNKYAGCTVDVCPVGALTDRDFRFKCRVWYLGTAPTICVGCSRGCNVWMQYNNERQWRAHKAGGARVMRLKPRFNREVNRWWMCDAGRYGYRFIDAGRLTTAGLARAGEQRPCTWGEASERLVSALAEWRGRPERVGVLLSTALSNEDLYAAKRLCTGLLGVPLVTADVPQITGDFDDILIQADKSPNRRGAELLGLLGRGEGTTGRAVLEAVRTGTIRVLWVFGVDLAALYGEDVVRDLASTLELFCYQGSNANATARLAHVVLPACVYAETDGTFINCDDRLQRATRVLEPLGASRPHWQIAAEVAERLGEPLGWAEASDVFAALAQEVPACAGLSYERVGVLGAALPVEVGRDA